MATVNIPAPVTDGSDILTAWGNAIRTIVNEIIGDTIAGSILVGDGVRSIGPLNKPAGTGTRVLKFDLANARPSWEADTGTTTATTIGQALAAMVSPTAVGKTYIEIELSGTVVTVRRVGANDIIRSGIPYQATAPSSPNTGDLWLDSSS